MSQDDPSNTKLNASARDMRISFMGGMARAVYRLRRGGFHQASFRILDDSLNGHMDEFALRFAKAMEKERMSFCQAIFGSENDLTADNDTSNKKEEIENFEKGFKKSVYKSGYQFGLHEFRGEIDCEILNDMHHWVYFDTSLFEHKMQDVVEEGMLFGVLQAFTRMRELGLNITMADMDQLDLSVTPIEIKSDSKILERNLRSFLKIGKTEERDLNRASLEAEFLGYHQALWRVLPSHREREGFCLREGYQLVIDSYALDALAATLNNEKFQIGVRITFPRVIAGKIINMKDRVGCMCADLTEARNPEFKKLRERCAKQETIAPLTERFKTSTDAYMLLEIAGIKPWEPESVGAFLQHMKETYVKGTNSDYARCVMDRSLLQPDQSAVDTSNLGKKCEVDFLGVCPSGGSLAQALKSEFHSQQQRGLGVAPIMQDSILFSRVTDDQPHLQRVP